MLNIHPYSVNDIDFATLPDSFIIGDHCGGFTKDLTNPIFDALDAYAKSKNKFFTLYVDQQYCDTIINHYPHLNFKFSVDLFNRFSHWPNVATYNLTSDINYKNLVCSFNGSDHISRQLLVSILHKFELFTDNYVSKNFSYNIDNIDGYLIENFVNNERLYNKFFSKDHAFSKHINSFGYERYDHCKNIKHLEKKLTESFVHIVSETMATSYYPFITEKFTYSIVTKGLFLAYAQPSWHNAIKKLGFKLYENVFDYTFDNIQDPIARLLSLMEVISKFKLLNFDELYDLYLLELDNIEFNYDWFYHKKYLEYLHN